MSKSALSEDMGNSLTDLLESKPEKGGVMRVLLDDVEPDPDQPREEYTETSLRELAESIEDQGVLQPIVVRPINEAGKYVIRYGERRWRASGMAEGVDDIPVIVRELDGDSYDQMIENIQREDLTPMEIGKWILKRIDAGDEQKDIAKRLGKPDSFVSLHRALPKLPPFIMSLYVDRVIRSPRLLVDLQRAAKIDVNATGKFCGRITLKGGATKKEIDAFISDLKKAKALGKESDEGSDDDEAGSGSSGASKEPKAKKPTASVGSVLVQLGNNEKTGVLMLSKASQGDQVWVDFEGSEALMDMDQLKIVGVKL